MPDLLGDNAARRNAPGGQRVTKADAANAASAFVKISRLPCSAAPHGQPNAQRTNFLKKLVPYSPRMPLNTE
ncbi:hypothetical protein LJC07_07580 [Christensenellaceae bacterium OttesenSCG-928-L17]|nr:hypothetical protein [Christensenellaceae bacterium OttesenSCG-928-L17]